MRLFAAFVCGRIPIPDGVNRRFEFRFLHIPVNRLKVNRDAELTRTEREFDIKAGEAARKTNFKTSLSLKLSR